MAALQRAAQAIAGGATPANGVLLSGTAQYTAGSDEESFPLTMLALGPDDTTVIFQRPAGQITETRHPHAGSWAGLDGVAHSIAVHNTWTTAAWFSPGLVVASWINDPELVVSSAGLETRNGTSVQDIQCFRKPAQISDPYLLALIAKASQMDLFLDSTSSLPVALEFNIHPDNDAIPNIPVRIEYSAYTATASSGIEPFHIEEFVQNTPLLSVAVNTVAPSAAAAGQQEATSHAN